MSIEKCLELTFGDKIFTEKEFGKWLSSFSPIIYHQKNDSNFNLDDITKIFCNILFTLETLELIDEDKGLWKVKTPYYKQIEKELDTLTILLDKKNSK